MPHPLKIVSLVPSLSKTICDLGLQESLVGCTNFCISPKNLRHTAESIGGTKDPDLDKIRKLQPTHILANKEENQKEHVEELQKEFHVIITDPKKISDLPQMFDLLGSQLGVSNKTSSYSSLIKDQIDRVSSHQDPFSYIYLIWNDPYMSVSPDTYISDAMSYLGGENLLVGTKSYPEISMEKIAEFNPEYLFLSSEPFPFRNRQAAQIEYELTKLAPQHKIKIKWIDGQLLSWWGSMSLDFLDLAAKFRISNPESHANIVGDFHE